MRANWYSWLGLELAKRGVTVSMPWGGMPEPDKCRERVWKAFVRNDMLKGVSGEEEENVVVVGHSTGGDLALRLAEELKLRGLVICSAGQLSEELRDEMSEEESKDIGYYDRPWEWAKIKGNTQWIVHVHSKDDDVVPVTEAKIFQGSLQTEYTELDGHGHLLMGEFPLLLSKILCKLGFNRCAPK
uniref:Uncharacterized protein n=1 Tax=Lotharella oceanica TaxID=641309 RepID=A0A7S2XDD2_9EUKA|mmetsp:Transcript_31366/g.58488  ORF Transcript_31366/g.58488 Transcript_31366/m.58488 type:complete len:186 (+) Transcript_31366:1-558(+)